MTRAQIQERADAVERELDHQAAAGASYPAVLSIDYDRKVLHVEFAAPDRRDALHADYDLASSEPVVHPEFA